MDFLEIEFITGGKIKKDHAEGWFMILHQDAFERDIYQCPSTLSSRAIDINDHPQGVYVGTDTNDIPKRYIKFQPGMFHTMGGGYIDDGDDPADKLIDVLVRPARKELLMLSHTEKFPFDPSRI
jgi:hypothetical protein